MLDRRITAVHLSLEQKEIKVFDRDKTNNCEITLQTTIVEAAPL